MIITAISIFAFYINWISGNVGIIPIDTFGFLDTSHSILNGKLPLRDFWIFTGLLVDYMGALFLSIFGNSWSSHLIHSSSMNILAVLFLYFFLNNLNLKKKIHNFLLCFICNSMLSSIRNTICIYSFIYFFFNFYNDFYFSF